MNKWLGRVCGLVCCVLAAMQSRANPLEAYDLTGTQPSPIPGQVLAPIINRLWNDNCVPLRYNMNTTIDPIPNARNAALLPLAEAVTGVHKALKLWTDLPTSFIDLRLNGTTDNEAFIAIDFVNEITFREPVEPTAYIAASYVYSFPADVTLVDGDDIDGDGDPDVAGLINRCGDVDGDGDFELPAGFYQAGTIFENDVHFDTSYQFEVAPAKVNDSNVSDFEIADLVGVAAHELGHSFGLGHSMLTEIGGNDGAGSTMATGDFGGIGARLARRTLHTEDEAWASYLYPEGSAKHGLRALQRGDIPFEHRYTLISGRVADSAANPVAGSSVYARNFRGEVVSTVIAGHVQLTYDPSTGILNRLPGQSGVIDGAYVLPVPRGLYKVGIEAVDGLPFCGCLAGTALAGLIAYGELYREEYWSGPLESGHEVSFGYAHPVVAFTRTRNVDFVIEDNQVLVDINSFDALAAPPAGFIFAARLSRERVVAVDEGNGVLVQAALFFLNHFEAPKVAKVDAAMITTGRVLPDGSARIDLRNPLVRESPFVGQDNDDSPLYVPNAKALGNYILERMSPEDDLFLVLDFPSDAFDPPPWMQPEDWGFFPGASPLGISVDIVQPGELLPSNTYYSNDGGRSFVHQPTFGTDFELVVTPRP